MAEQRVKRIQWLLEQIGLEAQRVRMVNLSSAMAGQFVAAVNEMDALITALGPSPLKEHKEV